MSAFQQKKAAGHLRLAARFAFRKPEEMKIKEVRKTAVFMKE
jgi:hypothetical protein